MNTLINFLINLLIINQIKAWDLSQYEINNDYFVSSIAVHRNRAFLTLPRDLCYNNLTNPTVIEVPWHEDGTNFFFNALRRKLFRQDSQNWGVCEDLQNAVAVLMDPKKPKLWVLDKGNEYCPAKIHSYNLFNNQLLQNLELKDVPQKKLSSFILDPISGDFGPRAFIAEAEDNTLLIFQLSDLKIWRLKVPYFITAIKSIAVSKVEPLLFISDTTKNLYALDLDYVRKDEGPLPIDSPNTVWEGNVTSLGELLDYSTSLESDSKGGLIYFLPRFSAIVRWKPNSELQAENHEVLAQSSATIPFVSQIFTGPENGIWALVNPASPEECKSVYESIQVENRLVKVLKFNKYFR